MSTEKLDEGDLHGGRLSFVVFMSRFRLTLNVSPIASEDVAKYARLVAVVERCGTILSRIKMHKILYVLKSLGYPVPERFEYRHYGPYSEDLAADLQSAVNATYLQERATETPGDEDEEPYRRYDYSPARRGSELVASVASSDPTQAAVADSMAGVAEELNESPPTRLELVATLMYLQDLNVPRDLIIGVLQASKPQFTEADIRAALEYIADLRARASFTPPLDLSSIIGLVKEGPPSDAAQDLDEEIYGSGE
ncbi:MAG TPA: hypothetical protein VEY12_02500 [Thermoplasmata archaeon]|nr:hypothetical protein [Thermoplasmata archaeon]